MSMAAALPHRPRRERLVGPTVIAGALSTNDPPATCRRQRVLVVRFGILLALTGACPAGHSTAPDDADAPPQDPPDLGLFPRLAVDPALELVKADRGTSVASEGVMVRAMWRKGVTPRGIVLMIPAEGFAVSRLAAAMNRALEEGFNVAVVEPSSEDLATRLDVAAELVMYKSLPFRQKVEDGVAVGSLLFAVWLDEPDLEEAKRIVRTKPPYLVGAIVIAGGRREEKRYSFVDEHGWDIHVLESSASLKTSAEHGLDSVFSFLDDGQSGRLRGETPSQTEEVDK
jgi:hypothetical protein